MRVKKILFVMGKTPLGHNRAAARDDSGEPTSGQRNPRQTDTCVQCEVVYSLFCLLDEAYRASTQSSVLRRGHRLFQAPGRWEPSRWAQGRCAGSTHAFHECTCPWRDP